MIAMIASLGKGKLCAEMREQRNSGFVAVRAKILECAMEEISAQTKL
jgi:hypothetical protein